MSMRGLPADHAGVRFGRLVVLSRATSTSRTRWLCRCDCGAYRTVITQSLVRGETRSCGCVRIEDH